MGSELFHLYVIEKRSEPRKQPKEKEDILARNNYSYRKYQKELAKKKKKEEKEQRKLDKKKAQSNNEVKKSPTGPEAELAGEQ